MIIKNRGALCAKLPKDLRLRRKILLDIAEGVLADLDPRRLLATRLRGQKTAPFRRVAVFAIGKAAHGMAEAARKLLPQRPDIVLLADEGHPFPTARGIAKTKAILECAAKLTKDDLAIVLISGGGSAMFELPAPGIPLRDCIATTKGLLHSGATINEINIVRKHCSMVKGGRFAEMLFPAKVWGYIISDVVGNDYSTIASGPLSPDPSTFRNALNILKKYRLKTPRTMVHHLQSGAEGKIQETPKSGAKIFSRVKLSLIANHRTVRRLAALHAKKTIRAAKIQCTIHEISNDIIGEAKKAAADFIRHAKHTHGIWIGSGETTVTVQGSGYGGRNQEFALAALAHLSSHQTLLSVGTDGIDGICPEKIAGAIADVATLQTAQSKKLSSSASLAKNDSYSFFKKSGGLIKTGPTGTNLGDLILLLSIPPDRSQ